MKNTAIVLASGSPRRRELLAQIGVSFTVRPARGEELRRGETPAEICLNLARDKAGEIAEEVKRELNAGEEDAPEDALRKMTGDGEHNKKISPDSILVLGADTIVVKEGKILGKPGDPEEAKRMLRFLSGSSHEVITGVCCLQVERDGERASAFRIREAAAFTEHTRVCVAALSAAEIEAYTATGDPLDKAGAYGIQGPFARHIEKIDGDYYNVVGLPLHRLYAECLKDREQ